MDEWHARRVLVTGAAGFIGANLVNELIRRGAEVHAQVRPTSDLWRLNHLLSNLTLHRGNIADAPIIRRIHSIKPEFVFHLAVQRAQSTNAERRATLMCNLVGTFNLLEATRTTRIERFIYASSSLEYGPHRKPLSETDHPTPATFYGASRLAATIMLRQFAGEYSIPAVVLRLFSVYGYWEGHARLIPTAIHAALGGHELALTARGFRRDYVFVEDVVEALLLAARVQCRTGEIINIGSGKQTRNERVVALIGKLCGTRIRVRAGEYPARAADTTYWVADIRKAQKMLGWGPRHSLQRGLAKTIEWIRAHPGL